MLRLTAPIRTLHGVGPSTATKLERLGIRNVLGLISMFPLRHDDLRQTTPIASLTIGATAVVRARVQLLHARRGFRRRIHVTEGIIADRSGSLRVVWFNQPYLTKTLQVGDEALFVGKLASTSFGQQLQTPLVERLRGDRRLMAGRIVPIYRATAGLTQRQLRILVAAALPAADRLREWLPEDIGRTERLIPLRRAIQDIHFPSNPTALAAAERRLKFGELLTFSLSQLQTDHARHGHQAPSIPVDAARTAAFVRTLPFTLTRGQRTAAWAILNDLSSSTPMHRLLEGDVGSGKTVVAAIAFHALAAHGYQGALLAPTDILARQHYATLTRLFGRSMRLALLTRTQQRWNQTTTATKRSLLGALRTGQLDVVVGTHAILHRSVTFPRLALVVVDEQHRFGVEQRHALQLKGVESFPHLLTMTATPIPRTLALTLFGDLRLSQLRELPPGRVPVETEAVDSAEEEHVVAAIHQAAQRGEQTFVVCPFIEESDELGVTAATSEFERLGRGPLAGLRLGLLHGRLSRPDQQRVLDEFAGARLDVIVTTPVVEVGVDVPNATIMVIEGAERFGLAQLHQLRGRVGRSRKPSRCFLVTDSINPEVRDRLAFVARTNDGFALAEEDLRRRGPGDLYGLRQSGLPEFKLATLADLTLMRQARDVANRLLADDPLLRTHPLLARRVTAAERTIHRE